MSEQDVTDVADESTADDTTATEDTDEPLGEPGRKALDAEKAKRRELAAELRRWKSLGVTPDEVAAMKSKPAEAEAEIDRVRREAMAEATKTANARIAAAEVKAAAVGVLADPTDALAFLDLSSLSVSADGEVDTDEIADALKDLVKRKPHLAAQRSEKRFTSNADQGARKAAGPAQLTRADLKSMTPEQIDQARREGRLKDLLGY